jgi:hydrogenase maturation factor
MGALAELAAASRVGLRIELDAIPVRPEVRLVCDAVGIDPYTSISEGTLIATVRPEHADGFLAALVAAGIPAALIGDVTDESFGTVLIDRGTERPLEHPGVDPFWTAFGQWASEST